MATAQSGIFALGTGAHAYMEFSLREGADPAALARKVGALPEPRMTTGGLNLVVGFRPSLWPGLAPSGYAEGVRDFAEPLRGVDGYQMPATQQDLWLWVAGYQRDKVFDAARDAIATLAPLARLADEVVGWTYKESRDLTGFIDGTKNPSLVMAPAWALVPEGQPGASSSVVLVQKWTHDATAWDALPVERQELVMGRTKPASLELPEDMRGQQSHISRTTVEEDGTEVAIFRRNTPFGSALTHGTYFVGFSAVQERLARMLRRMAGAEDGIRDALTRYAVAETGAYYVVPCIEDLRSFAPPDEED